MNQKRPSTIEDAIKMLDEALVKQQMPELSPAINDLIRDDFQAVKAVVGEETVTQAKEFSKAASELGSTLVAISSVGLDQASAMTADAVTHAKKLATDIDRQVRANPWPVIGGLALGGLALGLLLAVSKSAGRPTSEAAPDPEPERKNKVPPGVLPDGIDPEGSVI